MRAVQSLVRTLCRSLNGESAAGMNNLIVDMVQECKTFLREPEKSRAKHAVKLLGALIRTSSMFDSSRLSKKNDNSAAQIRRYAITECLPHLLALYRNPDEMSFRGPTLACITGLLMALAQSYSETLTEMTEKPLSGFEEQLFDAFAGGILITTTRRPSIEGFLQLVKIPEVCSVDNLRFISHSMNELLVSDSRDVELEDLR